MYHIKLKAEYVRSTSLRDDKRYSYIRFIIDVGVEILAPCTPTVLQCQVGLLVQFPFILLLLDEDDWLFLLSCSVD